MRQPRILIYIVLCAVLLTITACNSPSSSQSSGGPVLGWSKDPTTVIFRLDQTVDGEPQIDALNRLPRCTIYGDGHVVWVNSVPPNGEQVLETQIDDSAFRAFLEFVVRDQKFYDIPDYAAQRLPSPNTPVVESITLNLNQQVRTIRNYDRWPGDVYNVLFDKCSNLTNQPVLYVPTGAWVTAYPIDRGSLPEILWQPSAPFRLSDVAASKTATWATDVALRQLWTFERQTLGKVQWNDNDKYFRVVIQVPGISRDSPPPPSTAPTPAK